MDALFASMQQVHTMQVQQMRDKSADSDDPEAVKPGTTTLHSLNAPDPSSGSLDFQDWLELVAGLMGDLSEWLLAAAMTYQSCSEVCQGLLDTTRGLSAPACAGTFRRSTEDHPFREVVQRKLTHHALPPEVESYYANPNSIIPKPTALVHHLGYHALFVMCFVVL